MSTTAPREGTGTRDWTPPSGEVRPSSLGACPIYAWHNVRTPEDERPQEPIGKLVQFEAGHAAEHEYIRLLEERRGEKWTVDYELDNGYGGICHPDALHFERRVVMECKFTGFSKPAAYHLAQIRYYMIRMSETTGEIWTGEIHFLSKHGAEPQIFEVPFPDAAEVARLKNLADQQAADTPPPPACGMCRSREDAMDVRYYDKANNKKSRAGQEIMCPMISRCFPPPDDDCEIG